MPFHDQPHLASAAGKRSAENRAERNRRIVARTLNAMPAGGTVEQISAATKPHLGRTSVTTAAHGLFDASMATRTRVSSGPARTWSYRLTETGRAYAQRSAAEVFSDSRRAGQMVQAASRRERTRQRILDVLDPWPNAHTIHYIATHIGMSESAVGRALPVMVDAGDVLAIAHPFNKRQRIYWLPHRS